MYTIKRPWALIGPLIGLLVYYYELLHYVYKVINKCFKILCLFQICIYSTGIEVHVIYIYNILQAVLFAPFCATRL